MAEDNNQNKKRRRWDQFFDYGSPFYTFGAWIFDLFMLNCVWILTSGAALFTLLIFLFGQTSLRNIGPIGYVFFAVALLFWCPATTALYYIISKKWRKHEAHMYRDYFRHYRENFKQTFLLGLLITLVGGLLLYNLYLTAEFPQMYGGFTHTLRLLQMLIGVELIFTSIYAIALLARLKMSTKDLIRNSFIMANKHLLPTLLCAAVLYVVYRLMLSSDLLYILLYTFVVVSPATLAIVLILEKMVLCRYIPDEDDLEEAGEAGIIMTPNRKWNDDDDDDEEEELLLEDDEQTTDEKEDNRA